VPMDSPVWTSESDKLQESGVLQVHRLSPCGTRSATPSKRRGILCNFMASSTASTATGSSPRGGKMTEDHISNPIQQEEKYRNWDDCPNGGNQKKTSSKLLNRLWRPSLSPRLSAPSGRSARRSLTSVDTHEEANRIFQRLSSDGSRLPPLQTESSEVSSSSYAAEHPDVDPELQEELLEVLARLALTVCTAGPLEYAKAARRLLHTDAVALSLAAGRLLAELVTPAGRCHEITISRFLEGIDRVSSDHLKSSVHMPLDSPDETDEKGVDTEEKNEYASESMEVRASQQSTLSNQFSEVTSEAEVRSWLYRKTECLSLNVPSDRVVWCQDGCPANEVTHSRSLALKYARREANERGFFMPMLGMADLVPSSILAMYMQYQGKVGVDDRVASTRRPSIDSTVATTTLLDQARRGMSSDTLGDAELFATGPGNMSKFGVHPLEVLLPSTRRPSVEEQASTMAGIADGHKSGRSVLPPLRPVSSLDVNAASTETPATIAAKCKDVGAVPSETPAAIATNCEDAKKAWRERRQQRRETRRARGKVTYGSNLRSGHEQFLMVDADGL